MKGEIEISFEYTERVHLAAVRQYGGAFRYVLSGSLAVVLVALGLFTRFVADDSVVGWTLVAMGAVAFLQLYRDIYDAPRRAYRREARGDTRITARVSDAGLVYRARDIDAAVKWGFYRSARESADFYFLTHGGRDFSVIPKRAFAAAADEEAFRELLRRHLAFEAEAPEGVAGAGAAEYVPKSLEPPDWR